MPRHLVLRLKGPFASFGLIPGEEVRPTGDFPTRSMVLGLIGNALGVDRCDAADMANLDELQAGTRFAALVLSIGPGWPDVQNARVPALEVDEAVPKGMGNLFVSDNPHRRAEQAGRLTDDRALFGPQDKTWTKRKEFLKKPVQRRKHYVTDAHILVALSPISDWPLDPDTLGFALRHPARPLWLGRKTCPPSAPVGLLCPVVEAATGAEALAETLNEEVEVIALREKGDRWLPMLWEGPPEPEGAHAKLLGIEGGFPTRVLDRRDWRRGLHDGESVLYRGTMTPGVAPSDAA